MKTLRVSQKEGTIAPVTEFERLTKELSPLQQMQAAADLMELAHKLRMNAIHAFYASGPHRPERALPVPSGANLDRN